MPTYSLVVILYIVVQCVSLLLLSYLMMIILRSKPYFTKWTLFQVCISEFAYGLTSIPIFVYGDDLIAKAFDTPLCIIMQKVSVYFIYPLEFFSYMLAFYLWYALVRRDLDIEKKLFWYATCGIWIYTTIYNGALLNSASKAKNWGVLVSQLGCKTSILPQSIIGYIIPTTVLTFLSAIMTVHSLIILWRRHSEFSNIQNRRTAIKLGEAVRLCIYCLTFVILMIVPLVPRAIQGDSTGNTYFKMEAIGYFSGAIVGTNLFLIFGTDRKAALYLPFYYVPPEKLNRPFQEERVEIDTDRLDDEISHISKAYLRQEMFDVNSNHNSNQYSSTTSGDYNSGYNSYNSEEDFIGSYDVSRIRN